MNIPYETNELTLKIIHGLSGKDDSLSFAIKACETSILFDELHEELITIEAQLKENAVKHTTLPTMTNQPLYQPILQDLPTLTLKNLIQIVDLNPNSTPTQTKNQSFDQTKGIVSFVANKPSIPNDALPLNIYLGLPATLTLQQL